MEAGEWQAQVPITVWFPRSLELEVADPVLNRILEAETTPEVGLETDVLDRRSPSMPFAILHRSKLPGSIRNSRYDMPDLLCFPFLIMQNCQASEVFQHSTVRGISTWGGEGLDQLTGLDVTNLLTFESSDAGIVAVDGNRLQGLRPGGPVTVRTVSPGSVSASVQASSETPAAAMSSSRLPATDGVPRRLFLHAVIRRRLAFPG